jgi:hypothetical protein
MTIDRSQIPLVMAKEDIIRMRRHHYSCFWLDVCVMTETGEPILVDCRVSFHGPSADDVKIHQCFLSNEDTEFVLTPEQEATVREAVFPWWYPDYTSTTDAGSAG